MSKRNSWTSKFSILLAGTLMAVAGVALISPILPSVRETFGLSDFQASALIWVYLAPGVPLAPFIGYVADRWDRRRVLVASLLVFGVAGVGGAFVRDFHVLVSLRALQGIGGVSLPLMARTLIGDLYGQQAGRFMGYHDAVLSLGGAVFPVLGGLLGTLSWTAPFAIYGLAVPVAIGALIQLPPRTLGHKEADMTYLARMSSAIPWKPFGALLGCILVVFVLKYGFMHTALPFLLDKTFAVGAGGIGVAVGLMGLSVAGVSALQGRLQGCLSRSRRIMLGFGGYGMGLILATSSTRLSLLLAGVVLAGMGHGLLLPTINTAIVRLVDIRARASAMSIRKIFVRGGQTVGAPLLTYLGEGWGYGPIVFWTGGLVLLLAVVLFLTLNKSLDRNSHPTDPSRK